MSQILDDLINFSGSKNVQNLISVSILVFIEEVNGLWVLLNINTLSNTLETLQWTA